MALKFVYTLALMDLACAAVPHNHGTFHHAQSRQIDSLVHRAETHCFNDGRKGNNSWGPFQAMNSSRGADIVTPSSTSITSGVLQQLTSTLSRPLLHATTFASSNNTSEQGSVTLIGATQGSSVAAFIASPETSIGDLVSPSPSVSTSPTGRPDSLLSAGDGKKGLSYNIASLLAAFNGAGMAWAYNWKDTPEGPMPPGVEYVPMVWGLASAEAQAAQATGASHVLSFNEPDHGAQANMNPQTAAENHIKYLNPLGAAGVRVVSPAITNGASTNPPMGIPWLTAFLQACNGQCHLDAVAFHWYDSASNIDYFKSHVHSVIETAAQAKVDKVWLTEFGATGSEDEIANFVQEATSFLDATSAVERYAYFMVADGLLVNGNSLSTLGEAYIG